MNCKYLLCNKNHLQKNSIKIYAINSKIRKNYQCFKYNNTRIFLSETLYNWEFCLKNAQGYLRQQDTKGTQFSTLIWSENKSRLRVSQVGLSQLLHLILLWSSFRLHYDKSPSRRCWVQERLSDMGISIWLTLLLNNTINSYAKHDTVYF